jgi:hypothetical protein
VKRRGPGRPLLPKSERKGTILSVRVSAQEREQVEKAAQSLGLKAAAWARLLIFEELCRPPGQRIKRGRLHEDLSKIFDGEHVQTDD